eukprot:c18532_g1_i3.p1 GENE.c18532_g1_i3~~c18532_g1_i3.p1  ORF type:complete len:215 (+),score=34.29 c18532_g1_i3:50-694(+)
MLISQPMEARSQRDQFDTPTIHNIPEERPKHPMVLALMISVSSVCILALIATFSASENFSDNASVAANNPIRDLELDFKGDKQQPTDSLTCGSSIIGAQFSSARYAVYRIDFSGDRMKFGFRSCVAGNAPTLSVMGGLFGPVVASFGPNRDCLTEVFVDLDPVRTLPSEAPRFILDVLVNKRRVRIWSSLLVVPLLRMTFSFRASCDVARLSAA